MSYIHGVGVDYIDGEVVIHLQIANLASLGTPDNSNEVKDQVTIATSSGNTISSAIHNIYKSAQRRLYWGHSTFVILSEAAIKNNKLKESIDLLNRFPETRYRINYYTTKDDDVKELLKVSTIFKGTPILTRVTDLENTYDQSSLIQQISVRELIIQLDEPGYIGIIPTVALVKDTWESNTGPIQMIKDIGVAIVTPNDLQGFILNNDIKGIRWTQDSIRNNVAIYKNGKPISEIIVSKPKYKYNIKTENNDVTFHLKITAKGIINEMLGDVTQDFLVAELEKTIEKEVMHTYKEALNMDSDIYRLSEKLYRKHLKTWKKIERNGMIPLNENSLVVDVKVKLGDSKIEITNPTID